MPAAYAASRTSHVRARNAATERSLPKSPSRFVVMYAGRPSAARPRPMRLTTGPSRPSVAPSGEVPGGADRRSGLRMGDIVIPKDLHDKLSATPHAHLVEHRLEMVLHGVGGDSRAEGDVYGGHALAHEPGDRAFLSGKPICQHDDRGNLRR